MAPWSSSAAELEKSLSSERPHPHQNVQVGPTALANFASRPARMNLWVSCWDDLVDFEIVPVVTTSDFWAKMSET